jgi:hypothetical protein
MTQNGLRIARKLGWPGHFVSVDSQRCLRLQLVLVFAHLQPISIVIANALFSKKPASRHY